MSKVHISLVGGQPTPVYQGITYTQPDRIHLICSKNSLEQARVIRKELPMFSDDKIQISEISDSKVVDFERQLSNIVCGINPEDSVSINLSGGLKAWSIVLYKLAYQKLPQAMCFCLSQNGHVLRFDRSEEDTVLFDMEAQFKLFGNPLIYYFPFSDYTEEDDKVYKEVKSAYLFKTNKFEGLTDEYLSRYGESFKKSHTYSNFRGSIEWDAATHTCYIHLRNNEFEFSSPNAERLVFKADWFEYEVAKCMAQFYGKENVFMNCRFRSQKNKDKNEVDIIVNTGAKLIFVECKTKISKISDIDKFAAVVKSYGGMGSKAIFITMHEMDDTAKEKCKDNGINSEYLYNVKQDANSRIFRNIELKTTLESLVKSWNIK